MRARSFSHGGITVSDFNKAVRFYWDVFGCPLVGVADTPPDRVRTFFGVSGEAPTCKIGWIRVPGGGVLEIFEFTPHRPPAAIPWNRDEHAEPITAAGPADSPPSRLRMCGRSRSRLLKCNVSAPACATK